MQRRFWPLFVIAFALLAVACGRNNLERSCLTDADCAGDRVCVEETCTDPGDLVDAGDTDEETMDPDTTDQGCMVDSDCPGAGMCTSQPDDGCASFECVVPDGENSGTCERVECEPSCPGGQVAEGCECVDAGCETADDCNGLACIDGACKPCRSDEDCPTRRVCGEDGTCQEGVACQSDDDCPADKLCEAGTCVDRPECLFDDDCADEEICLNGRCTFSPECTSDADCGDGFECVGDQCFEEQCRGQEDCEEGEICEAGECIVPDPDEVDSCFVASRSLVLSENQRVRLEAFALDQDGEGIAANFEWTSSDPNVAVVENNQFAVGQGNAGTAVVTATVPSAGLDCSGEVEVIGQEEVAADQLRIVIYEGANGAPVSGAEVVLNSSGETATTDASGVAALPDPQGSYTVTVYDDRYNWVTVSNVQSKDIRIPVSKKSGAGPVAGFTGQFDTSRINTTGDITLGLAGASLSGGLIDLDLASLLGDPFVTPIEIPGVGGQDIPLPGGLVAFGQVLGFQLDIKKTYYANTTGGARLSWGLAGKVPAQRLISLFQNGGGQVDALSTLLPLFNRFDHALRPLNLQERPRVTDAQDIDGDGDTSEQVPDYNSFPMVDMQPSVQQNLVTSVDVSNFPIMSGGEASIAVLVGGTYLDLPGLVPLGISATNDEDGDGSPDARRLSVAPPHSSATGGRYVVMALAFRPDDVGFNGGIELPDEFSASLWNGQRLASSISLGTFPDVTTGSIDDSAREITVQADSGPLYRAQIVGTERTWEVWSLGSAGAGGSFTHTIDVPQPAGGRTDLLASGEVLVDAISTAVTLDDLVRATGVGLRDAGLVSTSFNRTKLRPTPSAP